MYSLYSRPLYRILSNLWQFYYLITLPYVFKKLAWENFTLPTKLNTFLHVFQGSYLNIFNLFHTDLITPTSKA